MFMHWYLATLIVSFLGFVVVTHKINQKIKKEFIILDRDRFSDYVEVSIMFLAMSMVPVINLMLMLFFYSREDETRARIIENMLKKGTIVPKDL